MWMGVFTLVGEMALDIRLLAKRGKGLRAIAREIEVSPATARRQSQARWRWGSIIRLIYQQQHGRHGLPGFPPF